MEHAILGIQVCYLIGICSAIQISPAWPQSSSVHVLISCEVHSGMFLSLITIFLICISGDELSCMCRCAADNVSHVTCACMCMWCVRVSLALQLAGLGFVCAGGRERGIFVVKPGQPLFSKFSQVQSHCLRKLSKSFLDDCGGTTYNQEGENLEPNIQEWGMNLAIMVLFVHCIGELMNLATMMLFVQYCLCLEYIDVLTSDLLC